MAELKSTFTRDDIATLIESMSDWEMIGSQEFHLMQMVMGAPLPPADHEAHDVMLNIKEYYQQKERDINERRMNRQEKAVFLKAKLMLVRREMDVNSVFEMATEAQEPVPAAPALPIPPVPATKPKRGKKAAQLPEGQAQVMLALAEYFIKDLGVWDHYQRFLAEHKGDTPS